MKAPDAIFPCKAKGKTPLTPNGCKDATTDPEWERQFPGCNWAIATGSVSGNLLVVDVDGIWDEPGEAWTAIANECGGLPRTVTALSGSGHSLHWYWYLPDGVTLGNTAGKLAPGIDTRGEGGYVMCPPSEHPSGQRYVWVNSPFDVSIAPIPARLLDLLLPKPRSMPLARVKLAGSSGSRTGISGRMRSTRVATSSTRRSRATSTRPTRKRAADDED